MPLARPKVEKRRHECEEGIIKSSGIFHESPVIHGGASIRPEHFLCVIILARVDLHRSNEARQSSRNFMPFQLTAMTLINGPSIVADSIERSVHESAGLSRRTRQPGTRAPHK